MNTDIEMKCQRKCAVCRERKPKAELLRLAKQLTSTEISVLIDRSGKAWGRGAYICKSRECILQARKRRVLERSLSCRIESSVYDELEAMYSNEQ